VKSENEVGSPVTAQYGKIYLLLAVNDTVPISTWRTEVCAISSAV